MCQNELHFSIWYFHEHSRKKPYTCIQNSKQDPRELQFLNRRQIFDFPLQSTRDFIHSIIRVSIHTSMWRFWVTYIPSFCWSPQLLWTRIDTVPFSSPELTVGVSYSIWDLSFVFICFVINVLHIHLLQNG